MLHQTVMNNLIIARKQYKKGIISDRTIYTKFNRLKCLIYLKNESCRVLYIKKRKDL